MKPNEIPQAIVDLLDSRADRTHSRDGIVLTTLAEILTLHDKIRRRRALTVLLWAVTGLAVGGVAAGSGLTVYARDTRAALLVGVCAVVLGLAVAGLYRLGVTAGRGRPKV